MLEEITAELKANSKSGIASFLKPENYELDHNKWLLKVPNDAIKKQLDLERDMVAAIRKKIGVPNLVFEIKVEISKSRGDLLPYTTDEKIRLMEQKNPNLRKLMKKFDTLANY